MKVRLGATRASHIKNSLVFFVLISFAGTTLVIDDTLFSYVRGSRRALFDFLCGSLGSSHSLGELRVAGVDCSGIKMLIVVSLQAEEALVLSKLVPAARLIVARLFETAVECVIGIGDPSLQSSLVAKSAVGNGRIGAESKSVSC